MAQALLALLALGVCLTVVLGPLVLALVAMARTSGLLELRQRVERLEGMIRELRAAQSEPVAAPPPHERRPHRAEAPQAAARLVSYAAPRTAPAWDMGFDWEWFIGRRALGWVAVVLLVFATAFFLRYAFENHWIGPFGRVTLAATAGMALVCAGWHYDRHKGWPRFAQMLTAAGVVLVYLAAYSTFGFYHLLPQRTAALFLLVILVETMALALRYDAPSLALVAVLGGLLTPVLMESETDQYAALFLYLVVLDVGVLLLALRRGWPVITTLALAGTHCLFWTWYGAHYHPEKLATALAFQGTVFLLFLGQIVLASALRGGSESWEDLGRWLLNAFLGFLSVYVLLKADHAAWMGSLALLMALLYAALARGMLRARPEGDRLFLTTLSIAVGFIAAAFPIQADASWIALGWAAEASALWWFGLRVRQLPLRVLAAVLAAMASARIVFYDALWYTQPPPRPVLNAYALPALAAAACLLAAVTATRRLQRGLAHAERLLAAILEIAGILQVWWVLTIDLNEYCRVAFDAKAGDDRMAQMALSVFWAVFATVVLAVGFRVRRARLRWTALGLYGITVGKVFLLDMSGLDQFYRILAFLALAVLLGIAAGVYQRIRPEHATSALSES